MASTVLGRALGAFIDDPTKYGLDFAFTATFLALLLGMWRGRGDLVPRLVGALVAIATAQLVEGNWYIITGGLAGSLAGAVAETIREAAAMSLESLITTPRHGRHHLRHPRRRPAARRAVCPRTGFVASWMKQVPGAVLASLVAPAILKGGPAEAIAAAAVALLYIVSRNLVRRHGRRRPRRLPRPPRSRRLNHRRGLRATGRTLRARTRPCGGIGRRSGLKIRRREACRFESDRGTNHLQHPS